MPTDYLRSLLASCSSSLGIVPHLSDRFEPLAAVYPATVIPLAERCLESHRYSLQRLAERCVSARLVALKPVAPGEERFFFNMNTPEDMASVCAEKS